MGCGCGCNKPPKGNFTYIRYASDKNGSDISAIRTDGGIDRCYQAIITSPIALDEESAGFPSLFDGRWFDICGCGCGCEWYEYNTPDYITNNGENSWTFVSSTAPTYSLDSAYQNRLYSAKMSDGDIFTLSNFRDNDDLPLVSGASYCFEFDVLNNFSGFTEDSVQISFGDGAGATVITIDESYALGPHKIEVVVEDGATYNSNQMVVRNFRTIGGTLEGTLQIVNFRLAPAECCEDTPGARILDEDDIPILQVKVKSVPPKNNDYTQWMIDNETAPGVPSTYMYTDEIWVKWNADDLEFLNRNPEIWLFQHKRSRKKKVYNAGDPDLEYFYEVQKIKWKHPSHQGGSKYSGSNHWGGDQSILVDDGVNPPGYFDLMRDTEFAISGRDVWTKIAFDPSTFFRGKGGFIWDTTTEYPNTAHGVQTAVRGVRGSDGLARSGAPEAFFRFAIVIDSDELNGSVTNPQPKKMIGALSPSFTVLKPKSKIVLNYPVGEATENKRIGVYRYNLGRGGVNVHSNY